MARISGKGGNVKIATVAIAGIRSWTVDYVMNTQETTGFDSGSVKEFLPTISEWSGSFEGFKDGAPISIGTVVALELEESATANQEWTGNCIVTGVHGGTAVDGVVTYSYDFQGTSTLTPASA